MTGILTDFVTFPRASGVDELLRALPDADDILFRSGVPARFGGYRYRRDSHLSVAPSSDRQIIRFGTTANGDAVGLDVATGSVVEVLSRPDGMEIFVNSSLRTFCDTVSAVNGRYPFYAADDDPDLKSAVAVEVRGIIESLDSPAVAPDCFWAVVVDDIEIGDFSDQDISDF
jgi:hypothetical protein